MSKRKKMRQRSWLLLITLVSMTVYLGKLGNDLLMWDDRRFILARKCIHSLANIPQFFAQDVDGLYRPLRTTLYAIAYQLFETNPVGYQALGVMLHVGCCLAIYLLFRRLGLTNTAAGIASLVFAVHPIHVERVAGVTASFDMLGDGLLILALAMYMKARTEKTIHSQWPWALVLTAGLFASEMVLVFVPMIICFEIVIGYSNKQIQKGTILRILTAIFATCTYLVARFEVLSSLGRGAAERPADGFWYNVLTVATIHLEYLKSFIVVWKLNYFHIIPITEAGNINFGIVALMAHLLVGLTALMCIKKQPLITLAIAWVYVMLIPFSQIVPNVPYFQERYAYLAVGGFAMLIGIALNSIQKPKIYTGYLVIVAIYVLTLSIVTVDRVKYYRNDLTLWTETAKVTPNHAGAVSNIGSAILDKGSQHCAKALPYFERAVELNPTHTVAVKNRAVTLRCLGQFDEAYDGFMRYHQLVPQDFGILYKGFHLGIVAGRTSEVIDQITDGLEEHKLGVDFCYLLALAFAKDNRMTDARKALEKYLAVYPNRKTALQLKEIINNKG